MDDFDGSANLLATVIAMSAAAFIFLIYHLVAVCLWGRITPNQHHQTLHAASNHVISYPLPHLIPKHKYHRKRKADSDDEGANNNNSSSSTCAVCLTDFEEGEELRTLPRCMHSFHVPCIDMWLYSHTTCPLCRAIATPFPLMLHHNHLSPHHSINMVQIASERS